MKKISKLVRAPNDGLFDGKCKKAIWILTRRKE